MLVGASAPKERIAPLNLFSESTTYTVASGVISSMYRASDTMALVLPVESLPANSINSRIGEPSINCEDVCGVTVSVCFGIIDLPLYHVRCNLRSQLFFPWQLQPVQLPLYSPPRCQRLRQRYR